MAKRWIFFAVVLWGIFSVLGSCLGQTKAESIPGILISTPAPDKDGVIKILLYYDMEGISGQNDMRSLLYGNEEYPPMRSLLTDDVNAVIAGLFAGGADVVDAHGSGNPEPDIFLDKMDSRAKMVSRNESFRPYCDLTEKDTYDAVAGIHPAEF
jgi:hypothetical protein